jgi:hypothetical protein
MGLAGHGLDHGLGDPRLADPRLAGEKDQLPLATLGLAPALEQQRQLLIAADDRRHPARPARGEPALERPFAQHQVSRLRLAHALEGLRLEGAQREQVADELAGEFADDHRARLGHGLQARGEVGGVADDRLLPGRALADQIADNHETRGDPDAAGERLSAAAQPRHRGHDREAGAHGPLGLVLVRPGPAEVRQDAVAHKLGDIALEAPNLARYRVLVGPQHVPHLLGIEARRQRGRAHQIDQHHGQLTALGLGS